MNKVRLICLIAFICILFSVNGNAKVNAYSNGINIAKRYATSSSKAVSKAKQVEKNLHKKYNKIRFCSGSKWKTIESRKDKSKRLVTYELGIVTNKTKDGMSITLASQAPYNYISYRSVPKAKPNDLILTYFVWCKSCNECDDILHRYDVNLTR